MAKSANEKLGLPRAKMQKVTIAFDIDGTLLNNEETGIDDIQDTAIGDINLIVREK